MGQFILLAKGSEIGDMKTSSEIRHANFLTVIALAGGQQALADRLEKTHSQISQLKNQIKHSTTGKPRSIGDDMARFIEERLGLEVGWMDNVHEQRADREGHANAPIPLPRQGSTTSPREALRHLRDLLAKEPPGVRQSVVALMSDVASKAEDHQFSEQIIDRIVGVLGPRGNDQPQSSIPSPNIGGAGK